MTLAVIGVVTLIVWRRHRFSNSSPESGLAAGGAMRNPYAAALACKPSGPHGNGAQNSTV